MGSCIDRLEGNPQRRSVASAVDLSKYVFIPTQSHWPLRSNGMQDKGLAMKNIIRLAMGCLCLIAAEHACAQFGQQDDYWWGPPIGRSGNVTYYANGGTAIHSNVVPYYNNRGYAVPSSRTVYSNGFTVTRIGNREYYHMSNYPPSYNSGYYYRRRW